MRSRPRRYIRRAAACVPDGHFLSDFEIDALGNARGRHRRPTLRPRAGNVAGTKLSAWRLQAGTLDFACYLGTTKVVGYPALATADVMNPHGRLGSQALTSRPQETSENHRHPTPER